MELMNGRRVDFRETAPSGAGSPVASEMGGFYTIAIRLPRNVRIVILELEI